MYWQQALMKSGLQIKLCAGTTSWFTLKTPQGSRQTQRPETYCRPDNGSWHFQLKQHLLQIISKRLHSYMPTLFLKFNDGTNHLSKQTYLSNRHLPEPWLSFRFALKYPINFAASSSSLSELYLFGHIAHTYAPTMWVLQSKNVAKIKSGDRVL